MRLLAPALLVSSLVTSASVHAQSGDKASAEILFNEGRALLQEGKYELACEKLAESQRMDAAVGTLLNLANCQEQLGRTASAWATWLEAAAMARSAGQGERESHARARAQALAPRLVTLTIEVPTEHRVEGLTISRNGVALGPALWGTAAPVDPGEYAVSAKAPGHQEWTTKVVVRDGTPARLLVPRLSPEPTRLDPSPSSAAGGEPSAPLQLSPEHDRASGPPRWLAYVAGGVGVVGVGVGTIFGLSAMSKNSESEDNCVTGTQCDREGYRLRNEAFDAASVSTVGFVVGAAGLGAAVVLWLTSDSDERPSAAQSRAVPLGGPRFRALSASAGGDGGSILLRGDF